MSLFIVPVVTATMGALGSVHVPKYSALDTVPLFTDHAAIQYGVEPYVLVSLPGPNAALSAEADCITLPTNLAATLTAANVTTVQGYLATVNMPSAWVTTSLTWKQVVRMVAQLCVLVQWIIGQVGEASVFTSGVTLNTTIAAVKSTAPGSVLAKAAVRVAQSTDLFSLAGITGTTTVGQALTSVAQQFANPIVFGFDTL